MTPRVIGSTCLLLALAASACTLARDGNLTPDGGPAATSSQATGGAAGVGGGFSQGGSQAATGGGGGTPTCQTGYECVPATDGDLMVAGLDMCPTGWDDKGLFAQSADQPGCETCSCGTPDGGSCSGGVVEHSIQQQCSPTAVSHPSFSVGVCQDTIPSKTNSFQVQPPTPSGGSCTPGQGAPNNQGSTPLCGLTAPPVDECGGGMMCVPDTNALPLCKVMPNGGTCDADYPIPRDVYEMASDDRTCICGCGVPTAPACTGSNIVLYNMDNCMNPGITVAADGVCVDTSRSQSDSFRFADAGTWGAVDCPATEIATGSVQFGAAQTLCCRE